MTYRRTNAVILIGLIGSTPVLLAVPWLRAHVGWFYPTCMLARLTGHACPMCGLTSGLFALLTGRPDALTGNPLTLPVAALFVFEFIARTILVIRRLSPEQTRRAVRRDLKLHATLLAAYLIYCLTFLFGAPD